MRRRIISIAAILLFNSDVYSQSDTSQSIEVSCILHIHAVDLSEDMSTMSSKNDELLLIIYKKQKHGMILEAPVYISEFVLDTSLREKKMNDLQLPLSDYLILMIELDEERPVEQIDPVIRVYWENILLHHSKKDRTGLSKYLQDNDLLGYFELTFDKNFYEKEIELKARQSMDLFHYKWKLYRDKK